MIRKLFKVAFAAALIFGAVSVNAGSVVLNNSASGCTTYSSVTFDGSTLTVQCTNTASGLTGQTIMFSTAPLSLVVGGATGTVTATATSSLAVTLTSQTTSVCTISGTTVTAVSAGTCIIAANQSGNGSYSAAPQVTQNSTISSGGGAGYTCNDSTTYDATLGQFPAGNGTTHLIPSGGGTAVGSFAFTLNPAAVAGSGYAVSFQSQVQGSYNNKDSAISRCKGDFTGKGITAGAACFKSGTRPTDGVSFRIGSGTGCVLDNSGTYYLNVRAQTAGDSPGIVLGFGPL